MLTRVPPPVPPPATSAPSRRFGERLRRRCRQLCRRLYDLRRLAMAAVLNRVATAQLRERAYREGFALALGDKGSHRWTSYLHEYHLGNQAGLHSRCSADPASGQPRPCLVRLDVGPTPAGDELGRALPAGPASVQRGRPGLNGAIATSWVTVIAWASRRLR